MAVLPGLFTILEKSIDKRRTAERLRRAEN
jgi:hypothetical protein